MIFPRQTLRDSLSLMGLGLHSGVPTEVRIHPGREGLRLRFEGELIPVSAAGVVRTERCTQLGPVSTVEHLMAALGGLEVTDAEIELTAPELPALDGSAQPYVSAIRQIGLEPIGELSVQGLFARLYVKDGDAKVSISSGEGHWHYRLVCQDRWPDLQEFDGTLSPEFFAGQIAPARTWGFEEEVEQVLARGLAKGLDWDSALVLGKTGYKNEARFADEPVRHKMLDLCGDLYLSGVPLRALNVVSARSGHRLNVRAAKLLADTVTIEKSDL